MKDLTKKETKQVVNSKKNAGYTWKQVTKQANDSTKVQLKDGTVLTPWEAWNALNVPAQGGVAKACYIKKVWYAKFRTAKGDPMIRKRDNVMIEYAGESYPLCKEMKRATAVKVWGWHAMKNAADVDKEAGDVKVTLDRMLQGLFDCKYFADAIKETEESIDEANKVTEGYINMGDNDTPKWERVMLKSGHWVKYAETKPTVDITVAQGVKVA